MLYGKRTDRNGENQAGHNHASGHAMFRQRRINVDAPSRRYITDICPLGRSIILQSYFKIVLLWLLDYTKQNKFCFRIRWKRYHKKSEYESLNGMERTNYKSCYNSNRHVYHGRLYKFQLFKILKHLLRKQAMCFSLLQSISRSMNRAWQQN